MTWPANSDNAARLAWLVENRGLKLPMGQGSVTIAESIDAERFGQDVTLHRAELFDQSQVGDGAILHDATLRGTSAVGAGSELGRGGPVKLDDALLGERVHIASGWVRSSVILDDAQLGFGSSVRQGCLIDAEASLGQSNDLKNSYLGVATLLGSSTNFCDIALCGGQPGDPVTQSEIGSGSIHFNFGIHGKKWGSWLGSIESLLLDRPRSFIGGNTALIGPVILPDGIITLVGSQLRAPFHSDLEPEPQLLVSRPGQSQAFDKPFDPKVYGRLGVKFVQSREIIGRYRALSAWFRVARRQLGLNEQLCQAAQTTLAGVTKERVRWLTALLAELPQSTSGLKSNQNLLRARAHERIAKRWQDEGLAEKLTVMEPQSRASKDLEAQFQGQLIDHLTEHPAQGQTSERILALPEGLKSLARKWLQSIVDESLQ